MIDRKIVALGALNGAIAVAAGAFAAHGLKDRLEPKLLEVFETAARYQMYHALAMVLAGLLAARVPGFLLQIGIVLFSGSLYLLALTNTPWLGAVTPFGGLAFIAGWLWLAVTAWRSAR